MTESADHDDERRTGNDHKAPDSALFALAILKQNSDNGLSYLDSFEPFVAESIWSADTEVVTTETVALKTSELFGLQIPYPVIKTLLKRLSRKGLLIKENRVYRRNTGERPATSISAQRDAVGRDTDRVVTALQRFARDRFELEWSKAQAEAGLTQILSTGSTHILRGDVQHLAARASEGDASSALVSEYVVGMFVLDCNENRPGLFERIEALTKGAMLTGYLYFRSDSDVHRKFSSLKAFFDTKILLSLLGYSTEAATEGAKQLLELCKRHGILPSVFPETLNELEGVLDGVAHAIRNGGATRSASGSPRGEIASICIDRQITPSDIEIDRAKARMQLNGMGLREIKRPPYQTLLSINEQALEDELADKYHNPAALRHDIDAVTAIWRARKGREASDLENTQAVFVTTNQLLVSKVSRFFGREYTSVSVPPCISDETLGTLLWLKDGMKEPSVPRLRIIADCYAALNPSDELWGRFLAEVDRLRDRGDISEADFSILRYSSDARRALMELTHADPDVVSEGTVIDVLQQSTEIIRREADQKLEAERKARMRAAELHLAEQELAASRFESKISTETDAHNATKERLQAYVEAQRALGVRVARGVANLLALSCFGAVAAVVSIGILVTNTSIAWIHLILSSLGVSPTATWAPLVTLFTLTYLLLGVANLLVGFSGLHVFKWIRSRVRILIEPRILRAMSEAKGAETEP